jgi:hypothetical protein
MFEGGGEILDGKRVVRNVSFVPKLAWVLRLGKQGKSPALFSEVRAFLNFSFPFINVYWSSIWCKNFNGIIQFTRTVRSSGDRFHYKLSSEAPLYGQTSQWFLACSEISRPARILASIPSQWFLACSEISRPARILASIPSQWFLACSEIARPARILASIPSQWFLACSEISRPARILASISSSVLTATSSLRLLRWPQKRKSNRAWLGDRGGQVIAVARRRPPLPFHWSRNAAFSFLQHA